MKRLKKYKKSCILCVIASMIVFLVFHTPSQFHIIGNSANYTSNPNIRIGLIYGSGAVNSFETYATAEKGFIIGQVRKNTGVAFTSLLTLSKNRISVTRARSYCVEFANGFSSFSEAGTFINNLPEIFTNAFPAYINGKIAVRSNRFSTVDEANAFISRAGGYALKAAGGTKNGMAIRDPVSNTTLFEYESDDNDMAVAVSSGHIRSPATNLYTGAFIYRARGAAVEVINLLSLEDYVKGVVSTEISPEWHDEVLKAFAIVARTYTLASGTRHASEGYMLCNDIHCQWFLGLKYTTSKSNAAVDSTKDLIITYNGKPINAVYCSSGGGVTETHSDAWGGEFESFAYLLSVPLPFENCGEHNNALWKNTVSPKELADFLVNTSSHSSRFKEAIRGDIAKIKINERSDPSNYIKDVDVIDKNGNVVNTRNSDNVRIAFSRYANSANMDIYTSFSYPIINKSDTLIETKELYIISADGISKTKVEADEITILTATGRKTFNTNEYNFVFDGKGWGHGVGMSQYAAKDLAESGYTYPDIIKSFYTGITISKITNVAR